MSSSPVLAADIQASYAKLPDGLLQEFDLIGKDESINVFVWVEDDSTSEYEQIVANLSVSEIAEIAVQTNGLKSITESESTANENLLEIQAMQNHIM